MSVNFTNNVPAAPTGNVNVTWAYDGTANASASIPVMVGDSGSGGTAGLVPAPPIGAVSMFLRGDGSFAAPSAAAMVGDTGSGGAAGIVPAPPAGSAAAGKFLKADGTWALPASGSGSAGTSVLRCGVGNPNGVGADIAPHTMTGENSPSPYVASASNESYGQAWQAFDGVVSGSGWLGNQSGPTWMQIDLGSATVAVTSYTLLSNYSNNTCTPTAWTLQGSNDGSTFTTLDTQTGQSIYGTTGGTYTFTNSTAYRYYRVNVTANAGNGVSCITELYLYSAGTPFTGGNAGDYYLDALTKILYGPLSGSSWPTVVTL